MTRLLSASYKVDSFRWPDCWLFVVVILLAGCSNGIWPDSRALSQPGQPPSIEITLTDAESPKVYHQRGTALWNGRTEPGGSWVAAVGRPPAEQIVVRNRSNNTQVTAALYRQNRQSSGVSFLISAQVAQALAIRPNIPTVITVTALRRETVATGQ